MGRKYRKFDEDFKQGVVALVFETGKPIAQVARELGVNEGTLGNWCAKARRDAGEDNGPEGRSRHPARDLVPGVVGQPGVVLQMALWRPVAAAREAGAAEGGDPSVVRQASRHLRVASDHRGSA
jgi:transposase-like protein